LEEKTLSNKTDERSLTERLRFGIRLTVVVFLYLGITLCTNWFQKCDGQEITNWGDGVERDPGYQIGYDGSGRFEKLGEYQKDINDPIKARQLDPKCAAKAFNNRGYMYRCMGQDQKAIVDLTKAIELDPLYTKALYNRIWAYQDLGQWQKDINDCTKLMELAPGCVVVYYHRAVAYGGLEQWQKAIDDCTKAIERDPKFAAAYMYRAAAYEKVGKNELAEKDRAKGTVLGRPEQ
jgi:tetratricopeptide (TPR) repeat protein